MKCVLLGYMASGKTFTASKLAELLGLNHIDLDHYIEVKENQTIAKIFKNKGEIYFRKVENRYLEELLISNNNFVLSVGGGTPCYGNNMEIIKNNSISFYLKGGNKILCERLIKGKSKRPLIALFSNEDLPEFIAKHLFERSFYYLQANHIIDIEIEITEMLNVIINKLNNC